MKRETNLGAYEGVNPQISERALIRALNAVAERCPRLVRTCYWAGTAAIAVEELHHRRSFDLDLHTLRALTDVRPLLAEIQLAFGSACRVLRPPDELGDGFAAVIEYAPGKKIVLEVLSNYQNVDRRQLAPSKSIPGLMRVSLGRYLEDKVQCLVDRTEARDLVDIAAVLAARPSLRSVLRRALRAQDSILLLQRMEGWTPASLRADLAAYKDIDPRMALRMRDQVVRLLRKGRP